MILYIKNMVCVRCIMAVQTTLEKLKIDYLSIELGKVKLKTELEPVLQKELNASLKRYDLELMEDRKKILVERIKTTIVQLLHSSNTNLELKLSVFLSESLHYNYTYLANTFSEMEGTTIERFYIENRVERVKELILYEELTLTEIADRLNYSSVAHLCLQFKKVTGQTPAVFKKLCRSDDYVWRRC